MSSEEEIRADIAVTRAELVETVDALSERLSSAARTSTRRAAAVGAAALLVVVVVRIRRRASADAS